MQLINYLDPALPSASRNYFVRCWHAETDGSAASTFHSNCDGKGPTVTIIKFGQYIFGGYTDMSWKSTYIFLIIIRCIFLPFHWPRAHHVISRDNDYDTDDDDVDNDDNDNENNRFL